MKKITLVCLIAAMILSGCSVTNSTSVDSNLQTTENTQQNTKNQYIMAGKIAANDEANIASKISARVSEVSVNIGSNVNKGDTIIKLDTQDLQAQVNQAQAAVNTAKASLVNATNGTRPEQIAQAQAALDNATESYEVTKKNYERTKTLVEAEANTQQQLESAEQQLVATEAQQKSAQEQLNMLKNGATETSIDVYKAQVEQAEAALKTAQTALSNGTITAPISGVVNAKNINIGEMASPSATLVSISNSSTLFVNAYAPSDIISELKEGQDVAVKVSEVPDTVFEGKIAVINSKLNSQSRNILVKVTLSDPNAQLKPGMFAEVGLKE
ncbi:efflux RND transporter periplasmic adaptor subunit [Clostridium uliginosum]|uniref:RND family efflux transporter, MFP subunit n=1 Tax=Clostridium uliginosum TaxID=119641 RepID=A0A1I1J6W0_9CLOT|nr:efflux RND transporter periplasmic adaptor subunit [Clostridium uliginosum]SFC41160.1 RND family efflux transporter, MFP subunit [Clostridium uliginosum]